MRRRKQQLFPGLAVMMVLAALASARTVNAARGGPDAGGWRWADSNEPTVGTGIESMLSSNYFTLGWPDEAVFAVNLSFPVTLYGTTSTTAWVSSNGWISLVDPGTAAIPGNAPMPGAGAPNAVIAAWWDDLWGGSSSFGAEGPTANGHRIDVRLEDKVSAETLQFHVLFHRNGSIKVVYALVPNSLTATVGIEDGNGTNGTQIQFDTAQTPGVSLANDFAILYHPDSSPACASAAPLSCPGSVSGTTVGGLAQATSYGCSGRRYTGNEATYALTISATSSFTATLTGAATADLFLLRIGCDGYLDCIAGGSPVINLPLLATGDYVLVVDALSAAGNGSFNISTTCAAVGAPITCGASVTATPAGPSAIDQYSCSYLTLDGPERYHDFTVATAQTVIATLSSPTPYDVILIGTGGLTPGTATCLRLGDQSFGEANLAPGDYTLVVDGPAGSTGSFTLSLDCPPQIPATPIACGQANVPGSSAGPSFEDDYPTCGAAGLYAGEAWYRFQPSQRVIATFSHSDPLNYDLFAFRENEATDRCLATADGALTLVNLQPESYLLGLDSGSAAGPVDLSVSCQPMAAAALACDATVAGVTAASAGLLDNYDCLFRTMDGSEAFFILDNPITQNLSVGVRPTSATGDVDVAIFGNDPFDATAPDCLAGGLNSASIANAPPGQYLVVVDGFAAATAVPFELTTACGSSSLQCAAVPDLQCNSVRTGDTATGTDTAFTYGNADGLYTGNELVYHFFNPVKQTVNFLLRKPSDPSLALFLLKGCDPGQLIDWDDTALIEPGLDPGDYYLVVDGSSATGGTFELVTFCGGPVLNPAVLRTSVEVGQCVSEKKQLFFPTAVPSADVVFSFDLSGSMGQELNQVKATARDIYTALNVLIPSLSFGLASFVEYDSCYSDTVCGVDGFCPPAPGAFPFRMDQPVTSDIARVEAVLQTINLIGGAKETYTRTFFEAYTNPIVGWRPCSRRLWLNFGDEVPVDCNVLQCIGQTLNTGRDPGPDLVTGTADDLELLPVVDAMAANNIALIHVDSSEDPTQIAMWDCLARRTGGATFITDANGQVPGGTDIVRGLVDVIKETLRPCPEVRLVPTGPQASWVTITPTGYSNVLTPFYGEFDLQFCVPAGTVPGIYSVAVEARCVGAGSCTSELLGTQSVELTVTDVCNPGPTAAPDLSAGSVCQGAGIILDGSASTACDAAGLDYRWLVGAVEICPWSGTPTCAVTPAADTTYTLEVRCRGAATACVATADIPVLVTPYPVPAIASLPAICAGASVTLDASATGPNGCLQALEYQFRDGATVLRAWGSTATFGPFIPAAGTTFAVDVRCPAAPGCTASSTTDLTVIPLPRAVAGPDVSQCTKDPLTLDGSGSSAPGCPAGPLYEWREGAVVLRPADPSPIWNPPSALPGTRTYTLVVTCASLPACAATADVVVTLRDCSLAVEFHHFSATREPDGTGVVIAWETMLETGTLGFTIERAATQLGPFVALGTLEAQGPMTTYRFLDSQADRVDPLWYRIVEITNAGEAGDSTPAFTTGDTGDRDGGGTGARTGRRGRRVR